MFKRLLPVVVIITLLLLVGCGCDLELKGSANNLVVMTYNVQNLFDPFVSGSEYPEYTPQEGWGADQYRERLGRTARAITQEHKVVPDIVVLQEIENRTVVEDLLYHHLGKRGFKWYAVTADSGSPIQIGVVSRLPILEARIHGVQGQRSLLEVTFNWEGETIVLFALHAKSRLGGIEESEEQRLVTAATLSALTADRLRANPYTPIIIAGDFNQSADTYKRIEGAYRTALVPYDALKVDEYRQAGSLIIGGVPMQQDWYTWWLDREFLLEAKAPGSYWYGGIWESFDQILLSPAFFDERGVEFKRGEVGATNYLMDDNGRPKSWNVKTGRGVSDHLPVYVVLSSK